MPYPNTVLSAWQLALVAVVAVGGLAVWLAAVYLSAREPRGERHAASASPGASPTTTADAIQAGDAEPAHVEPAHAGKRAA